MLGFTSQVYKVGAELLQRATSGPLSGVSTMHAGTTSNHFSYQGFTAAPAEAKGRSSQRDDAEKAFKSCDPEQYSTCSYYNYSREDLVYNTYENEQDMEPWEDDREFEDKQAVREYDRQQELVRTEREWVYHYAWKGKVEGLAEVLRRWPSLVLSRDEYQRSPLHYAAMSGAADVCVVLLDAVAKLPRAYAAVIDAGDTDYNATSNQRTALWYAATNGHADVVEVLLHGGADGSAKGMDSAGYMVTPRHMARRYHKMDVVDVLEDDLLAYQCYRALVMSRPLQLPARVLKQRLAAGTSFPTVTIMHDPSDWQGTNVTRTSDECRCLPAAVLKVMMSMWSDKKLAQRIREVLGFGVVKGGSAKGRGLGAHARHGDASSRAVARSGGMAAWYRKAADAEGDEEMKSGMVA